MSRTLLCLTYIAIASTCSPARPETNQTPASADKPTVESLSVNVMVLGAYHFGNPGLDLNNIDSDDVTSPQRQAELDALSQAILAFRPNVVAHEGRAEPPYLDTAFAKFAPSDLLDDPNEIVQIAYRVAYDGGIERVYAIDEQPSEGEPNYFPFDKVQAFAQQTDAAQELEDAGDAQSFIADFEAAQETETIPELLMMMNGDKFTDTFYWNMLKFGEGENQPGPELAAYWFMRNAKIFNKLDQNVKPGDRVVVVYGAGHGHWLREMVERTPGYQLEPVSPYLEHAAMALEE